MITTPSLKQKIITKKSIQEIDQDLNCNRTWNCFETACYLGETEVAKLFFDIAKDLVFDMDGYFSLSFRLALESGDLDLLKWFVSIYKGKPYLQQFEENKTALHVALQNRDKEVAMWLLETIKTEALQETQATLFAKKDQNNHTLLAAACLSGSVGLASWLLKEMPSLSLEGKNAGENILHLVCRQSQSYKLVEELMKARPQEFEAMLSEEDAFEQTPFLIACRYTSFKTVKNLYTLSNPDLTKCNLYGANPMHQACYCNQLNIVKWLHSLNPSLLFEVNKSGEKAYELFKGNLDFVKWLTTEAGFIVDSLKAATFLAHTFYFLDKKTQHSLFFSSSFEWLVQALSKHSCKKK